MGCNATMKNAGSVDDNFKKDSPILKINTQKIATHQSTTVS